MTVQQFKKARLARDARFDGQFFVAVKTTGIFCRPVCPAPPANEANVEYFAKQAQALQSGYRPCLRCRPDSAPGSWAWKGVETTFQRAVNLIDQGGLQSSNLPGLASRLGISDRYLRQLFQQYLGMSPKQYAQYQQLMFAKQLLHTSNMSIGDIAIASGFNSIRRFNDAFQKKLKLTPRDTRKASRVNDNATNTDVEKQLRLSYRPPFNWDHLLAFYRKRAIYGIEEVGENYYSRTFVSANSKGWFRAQLGAKNTLEITFDIDDMTQLKHMVSQIRRLFDLDADIAVIEQHLKQTAIAPIMGSGLRIPGVWSTWEAGVRAIFGQQVSIVAAITVLNSFVQSLHEGIQRRYFPTPSEVASADLSVLRMPQARKDTLKRFAEYMVDHFDAPPEEWLALKGIGPWTVSYAKLRGLSQPDCFLSTDLVIKKAIAALSEIGEAEAGETEASSKLNNTSGARAIQPAQLEQASLIKALSPWGSYATFNCWNSQS